MSKASRVIVLAEDVAQQAFARRCLYAAGFRHHEVHCEPLPSGKGSGEHWVRKCYVAAVDACRLRSARATQLADALSSANRPARRSGEPIAHLIPKRNIETWLLFLTGSPAVEESDYKTASAPLSATRAAAQAFVQGQRGQGAGPASALPSVRTALAEWARLPA